MRDIFNDEARLTPRYLLTLIRGLPESSRFVAERRGGPQFRGWDASLYTQVATVNALRALTYVYVAAHSKNKPPAPEPFPVPDTTVRKPRSNGPGTFAFIAASKIAAAKKARSQNG